MDFKLYVKRVREEFTANRASLLAAAKELIPEVSHIELTGSYHDGNPTEDSDVDLMVLYTGPKPAEEVAAKLYGRLHGDLAGAYDIVVAKRDDA